MRICMGDRYRLPSQHVIVVLQVRDDAILCRYVHTISERGEMCFSELFMRRHAWRLD